MPEGPTIAILREEVKQFIHTKIIDSGGNAKIDTGILKNKKVIDFKTWGKQFIICVNGINIRIHLLMFGSYSINEQTRPKRSVRLFLKFKTGTVYFYTCSVKVIEGNLDDVYDWSADIMNKSFDIAKARKKLKDVPDKMVCDVLLDQDVFSGVGNIIKNEVLYRIRLHPETLIKDIPPAKVTQLIKEARKYSFEFLKWKRKGQLKQHWLAYAQKECNRCELPFVKKYCGKTKRRTFFCENCQLKYT